MTQQQKDSAGVPEVAGQIARAKLGIEQLRPGQEEAIAAVLAGHDTLALMPTGSGKSAIYQIAVPSLWVSTLVRSPRGNTMFQSL